MLRRLILGISAGCLAGSLVGLCEALYVLTSSNPTEYVALLYAVVLYAGIGMAMGTLVGIAFSVGFLVLKAPSEALGYTLSFLCIFCAMGTLITRYILNKAVFMEQGIPVKGLLLLFGGVGFIFLAGLWLGQILLQRTPFKILLRLKGTAALYGAILALSAVFSLSPAGGSNPAGMLSPDRAQTAELREKPNVILLVVDTLRADHLGTYGKNLGLTPNFDRIASDGVVFEQAFAQASWTRPSMASIFTSLVPTSHDCSLKAAMLPDEVETLAETVRAHGMITGGLPDNANLTSSFNFQQGFDYYQYQKPEYILGATESASQLSMYDVLRRLREKTLGGGKRVQDFYQPAEVVFTSARKFIDANKERRWFLFVHLMEPHDPYFEHPYNGLAFSRMEHEHPDPQQLEHLRELYRGEVANLDERMGEFIRYLEDSGLYDDSMIVVASDHGEEFLEHGGWWHGSTLYDELLHVPLIVKLPNGARAGTRVPWQVRLIDVAPTISEVVGAPTPDSWQGINLFDDQFDVNLSFGRQPPPPPGDETRSETETDVWHHPGARVAIAEENFEGNVLSSIRSRGWKLMRSNQGNPRGLRLLELYHVAEDPGELKDLTGTGAEEQGRLDRELKTLLERAAESAARGSSTQIDAATEAKLRALGYTE